MPGVDLIASGVMSRYYLRADVGHEGKRTQLYMDWGTAAATSRPCREISKASPCKAELELGVEALGACAFREGWSKLVPAKPKPRPHHASSLPEASRFTLSDPLSAYTAPHLSPRTAPTREKAAARPKPPPYSIIGQPSWSLLTCSLQPLHCPRLFRATSTHTRTRHVLDELHHQHCTPAPAP